MSQYLESLDRKKMSDLVELDREDLMNLVDMAKECRVNLGMFDITSLAEIVNRQSMCIDLLIQHASLQHSLIKRLTCMFTDTTDSRA